MGAAAAAAFTFALVFAIVAAAFTLASASAAAAALVDVAMGNLIFGRGAHILYGHVEIEVLTSKRVITVDGDIVFFDFDHANRDGALIGAGLKLHANFELFDALKAVAGHHLLKSRIQFAVAFFRSDANLNRFANRLAQEGRFETWNDVIMAVKIAEWLSWLRLIDDCSIVVFKRVVHGDDCSFCNLHDCIRVEFLMCAREEAVTQSKAGSKKKVINSPPPSCR